MASIIMFSVHHCFYLFVLLLLLYHLQHPETAASHRHKSPSFSSSSQPVSSSLKDAFHGNRCLIVYPPLFKNTFRGIWGLSRIEIDRCENVDRRQQVSSGSERLYGAFNCTRVGRNRILSRRPQHKLSSSPSVRGCCSCSASNVEASESDRRGRENNSASWTGNSTYISQEQAEGDTLSCPHPHMDMARLSRNNVGGEHGRRWIQCLSLVFENQHNHEMQGKGSGRVVLCNIFVSLLAAWLLFMEDQLERKAAMTGLKYHLLRLLQGFAVRARRNEDTQTTRSSSSHLLSRSSSLRPRELPEKKSRPKAVGLFLSRFDWCFNIAFAPFPRLWTMAPVTYFLPNLKSQEFTPLDHVGCRLATMAALPSSYTPYRVRLVEGGFHFNPSVTSTALICHRCPAVYSLDQPMADAPSALEVHRSVSPWCPVIGSDRERHRSVAGPAATSAASTSAFVSLPGRDVPGSALRNLDHGDRQELSEDSEARTAEGGELSKTTAGIQPNSSFLCDTGCLLALPQSMHDQRLEPTISGTRSRSSSPSTSFCSSSSSSFSFSSSSSSSTQQSAAQERPDESDSPREYRVGSYSVILGEAVYPLFSTTQSRLDTFRAWPSTVADVFPAHRMVQLGFYYAGYADCVRCFYCGVGLKCWDPQDDPLTEHLRYRPHCGFLLAVKGRQRIESVLRSINSGGASEAHPEASCNRPQGGVSGAGMSTGIADSSQGDSQGAEGASGVLQQLITIGFSPKDIDDARRRLRGAGVPDDLECFLEVLLPGPN